MRNKKMRIAVMCMAVIFSISVHVSSSEPDTDSRVVTSSVIEVAEKTIEATPKPEPKIIEPVYPISQEEIELIALVTMAEAEGESVEGKRLVIDTILNRVDARYWPNTVTEVIYQPSQFTSMWNGRVNRCYVRDDICQLVKEELLNRTNNDVVFFTAGKYGKYGTPMFQVGNHYFASYN